MVSLSQRQALASSSEIDSQLKRFQLLLEGEDFGTGDSGAMEIREELLLALATGDAARFLACSTGIGQRKISSDSDWCQDDYLLFLLILGNEKFGHPLTFLGSVIESRWSNPNPTPRRINEVFAALERREFAIEGEFCFLKIPFLYLVGKLQIGPTEARAALKSLSEPGLLEQMSPFMQLLTQKAHDLVLTERQPLPTETTTQLIEGIEAHAKDLSIRQWWRALTALPGRMIITVVALVVGLGLIPVLLGVGKGIVESRLNSVVRVRPTTLTVTAIREVASNLPPEALVLARALPRSEGGDVSNPLLVTVEIGEFSNATPSFVVEVSHSEKPILGAFAFTQARTQDIRSFTIVPVERDGPRFRAILPEQAAGNSLRLILEFQGHANEDISTIGTGIAVRALQ